MTHPYADAAPHRLWRHAVAVPAGSTDPVVDMPFRIGTDDRIVTAGSCFAQHIARRLTLGGFSFLVTERAHPILPPTVAARQNYGRFAARYGNIYTARQLLQLLRRVYGRFDPVEDVWSSGDGTLIDPFRPQIQPGGFATPEEYRADRAVHFAAVRAAFEQADVLIFTLGLTETWASVEDGAVFPACPGTFGGRYDPARHRFENHEVGEVVADLVAFLDELRAKNSGVRVILTVSPVPLVATATNDHVLVATTYSKSVLRVAAGVVARDHDGVAYFPAFEIVNGPQARGAFFAEDLRSVTEEGVDRVMDVFFRHATIAGAAAVARGETLDRNGGFRADMRTLVDLLCDEEALDAGP